MVGRRRWLEKDAETGLDILRGKEMEIKGRKMLKSYLIMYREEA